MTRIGDDRTEHGTGSKNSFQKLFIYSGTKVNTDEELKNVILTTFGTEPLFVKLENRIAICHGSASELCFSRNNLLFAGNSKERPWGVLQIQKKGKIKQWAKG